MTKTTTTAVSTKEDANHISHTTIHWIFTTVVPPLYVAWRVAWANRLPITDCDEVYNYWEPLHFMLWKSGQQTWEYAHEHALRTHAYLVPLRVLTRRVLEPLAPLLSTVAAAALTDFPVSHEKLATFVMLRSILAAFTAAAELSWLSALWSRQRHVSKQQRRILPWTTCVLLTAAGMNHAAGAYLPSSTWLAAWLLCASAFARRQHYWFCTAAVTATLAIGWPFAAATLVPMALCILWRVYLNNRKVVDVLRLLIFTAVVTIAVQSAVMYLDYMYYGRWTSASWNILRYNAGTGGDELYGVEPASYYIKNLVLNLNLVAPLALLFAPALVLSVWRNNNAAEKSALLDVAAQCSSLFLWLAILIPRPHKEERFLFPVYPAFCLAAVWTVDAVGRFLASLVVPGSSGSSSSKKRRANAIVSLLHAVVWIPVILFSLARTAALSRYYTAPLHVYAGLAVEQQKAAATSITMSSALLLSGRVCTCGEWYRYPSGFFLSDPEETIAFLPSSFTGQLSQPFSSYGSLPQSQDVLQPFNDQNQHAPERYVESALDCAWIVDLQQESPPSSKSSDCVDVTTHEAVLTKPFLDAAATSTLHRILYLPYWHERAVASGGVQYQDYVLYRRKITAVDDDAGGGAASTH